MSIKIKEILSHSKLLIAGIILMILPFIPRFVIKLSGKPFYSESTGMFEFLGIIIFFLPGFVLAVAGFVKLLFWLISGQNKKDANEIKIPSYVVVIFGTILTVLGLLLTYNLFVPLENRVKIFQNTFIFFGPMLLIPGLIILVVTLINYLNYLSKGK